jgi:hypothetical protein
LDERLESGILILIETLLFTCAGMRTTDSKGDGLANHNQRINALVLKYVIAEISKTLLQCFVSQISHLRRASTQAINIERYQFLLSQFCDQKDRKRRKER